MDAIRLRVFVNPNDDRGSGHCSKDETIAFAKKLHKMGFRLMIDFHYSDSWADPNKQYKPKAWENLNFTDLKKAVYDHTYDVIAAMKKKTLHQNGFRLAMKFLMVFFGQMVTVKILKILENYSM